MHIETLRWRLERKKKLSGNQSKSPLYPTLLAHLSLIPFVSILYIFVAHIFFSFQTLFSPSKQQGGGGSKMCHPGLPQGRPDHQELAAQRRWLLLQLAAMVAENTVRSEVAASGDAREGTVKQYCLCSPTRHPGSFRCRLHRAKYVWGGRVTREKPSD